MLSIASLPPNANADTRHGDYIIKIIQLTYYQLFAYFLFSPFLPYFARFLLFSTLLVHFEISFSFAPLQYRKTKENQLFSVITRLRYLNRDKTSKQWQS